MKTFASLLILTLATLGAPSAEAQFSRKDYPQRSSSQTTTTTTRTHTRTDASTRPSPDANTQTPRNNNSSRVGYESRVEDNNGNRRPGSSPTRPVVTPTRPVVTPTRSPGTVQARGQNNGGVVYRPVPIFVGRPNVFGGTWDRNDRTSRREREDMQRRLIRRQTDLYVWEYDLDVLEADIDNRRRPAYPARQINNTPNRLLSENQLFDWSVDLERWAERLQIRERELDRWDNRRRDRSDRRNRDRNDLPRDRAPDYCPPSW